MRIILAFVLVLLAGNAWSACPDASGVVGDDMVLRLKAHDGIRSGMLSAQSVEDYAEGVVVYDGGVLKLCDGDDWIEFAGIEAATIANKAVTYAKIQDVAANRILGRGATAGSVQEITIGSGLTLTGTTLSASAGTSCSGHSYNGACWYLGIQGESCTASCASFGGYNSTATISVGSGGTNAVCANMLRVMGVQSSGVSTMASYNTGCIVSGTNSYRGSIATTAGAVQLGASRVCACNN